MVKDKESFEDPKPSLKMFISQSDCQFGYKFWIRHDEDNTFLINTHSK